MADFSPIADPENSAETIEELRARIAPFWNRRAIQHWTESARARITAAEARIAELEAQLAAHN